MTRSLVAMLTWTLLAQSPRVAPAPARTERPAPFALGETLTYDVSWSGYLSAGTLVSTVKEKKPSYNSTAYYIVAEGRPSSLVASLYPLYYKMDTLIDVYTLLAQRGSIYSEEGARHRLKTTLFDRDRHKASFEYKTTSVATSDFEIPANVQDGLSGLYTLRGFALKVGDHPSLPVTDNGVVYRVQIDVGAPEQVSVPFGSTSAWKLKLAIIDAANHAVGRDIGVWLSMDRRRLPVKVQADLGLGAFVLSLRDAK